MLKLYLPSSPRATESEFWERNWGSTSALPPLESDAEVDRICYAQPLSPIFDELRQPDRLFLEGGCGPAHWVRHYARRGQRIVGIDFAARTVERVRRAAPGVDVRVGDIHALPFSDGEVHLYYSGGVVEHVETGPLPALNEARRVLAVDGVFLCSVPDASPLRRAMFHDACDVPRASTLNDFHYQAARTTEREEHAGLGFFQYCFAEREFTALLDQAGFVVERTIGMFYIHGLLELPWLRHPFERLQRRVARPAAAAPVSEGHAAATETSDAPSPRARLMARLKRVLFSEAQEHWPDRWFVEAMRWAAPNMRLYVARPRR